MFKEIGKGLLGVAIVLTLFFFFLGSIVFSHFELQQKNILRYFIFLNNIISN